MCWCKAKGLSILKNKVIWILVVTKSPYTLFCFVLIFLLTCKIQTHLLNLVLLSKELQYEIDYIVIQRRIRCQLHSFLKGYLHFFVYNEFSSLERCWIDSPEDQSPLFMHEQQQFCLSHTALLISFTHDPKDPPWGWQLRSLRTPSLLPSSAESANENARVVVPFGCERLITAFQVAVDVSFSIDYWTAVWGW